MCFPIARYTVQRTTRFLVELSLIKTLQLKTQYNSLNSYYVQPFQTDIYKIKVC